ncbi:hypothetical protein A8C32_06070 [Flavivirga aquatica]|uniref:YhhN-like protein n=1 Tax=Flavivirga aquatica TaxID=1849968 RepID=A0A1E5SI23_9FLAO|nr:hypothetical protein [Flavivirga aquatica]OEJ98761.1 hypothetical protein A8C32_06070 [Flavivirga aquatica]
MKTDEMYGFIVIIKIYCYICYQPTIVNIMKNWYKSTFNKVFFGALLTLIVVNVVVAITENELLLQSTMPLFIPVFCIFFFIKYKYLSIPFISFLLFSFFGDTSVIFFKGDTVYHASNIFYFLSFTYLIFIIIPKFKFLEVDKLIGAYLLVVFLINLYFLYVLYGGLREVMLDNTGVILFVVKSLVLIVLGFAAFGVYLNRQTKQSILFLIAIICFSFSAILDYINVYYLHNWSFVMLFRVLYALGLYFVFRSVIEDKIVNKKTVEINDRFSSDNILA